MTTVDEDAAQARRRTLITGAAGYVIAQYRADRFLALDVLVEEYMNGQGLRRATWAAWDGDARVFFLRKVWAKINDHHSPPADDQPS